jgi:hypothetical protein
MNESIIPTIENEAKIFTIRYFKNPTEVEYNLILNAMLCATKICLQKEN